MAARKGSQASGRKRSSAAPGTKAAREAEQLAGESKSAAYHHPEAEIANRPDAGTQATYRKKKPAKEYRYDSSLAPALEWDGVNASVRERGEELTDSADGNSVWPIAWLM